jgi:hypothetical protein
MNSHFSEHDDKAQLPLDPVKNVPEMDEALAPTCEETSGVESAKDTAAPGDTNSAGETTPVARKKRAPRSVSAGGQARRRRPREDSIIELRVPARNEESARPLIGAGDDQVDDDVAREELVAQGFTSDEAARIVDLSARLGTSREARDAEASLRRLRFTRWLVERGVLDEFSA